MIYLLTLLVVVIGLGVVARSQRGTPRVSLTTTAVLTGVLIAAVRLGLFWGALALYSGGADARQSAGYVVLIVSSLPELAIAAVLSGHNPGAPPLVALLIALTSAVLGWLWAWIRFRAAAAR
jgi:hypothetical protein